MTLQHGYQLGNRWTLQQIHYVDIGGSVSFKQRYNLGHWDINGSISIEQGLYFKTLDTRDIINTNKAYEQGYHSGH